MDHKTRDTHKTLIAVRIKKGSNYYQYIQAFILLFSILFLFFMVGVVQYAFCKSEDIDTISECFVDRKHLGRKR